MQEDLDFTKEDVLDHIHNKAGWDIYSLAAHLGVKARSLYEPLNYKTKLMLVQEGRLFASHASEGLYQGEPKKEVKPSRQTPSNFFFSMFED